MALNPNRREFLKTGTALGAGLALSTPAAAAIRPIDPVRVGIVGVGGRGTSWVRNLLLQDGVELKAVGDVLEKEVVKVQQMVQKAGQAKPTGYSRGPRDFERMCQEEDLDLVCTATPWQWHVPVCVAAMNNGKHAATEVPAAVTLDECWEMVETSEQTGKYCVMLENCCYMQPEMLVLNMVRKGLLGELLHGEAGYLHDLRSLKMGDVGEGRWRGDHSTKRNGNTYPTHGLGPLAWCMNINHGDRFDYLVSMSSNARGLELWGKEHLAPDNPKRLRTYVNGDINSSLIRTVNGLTIVLQHNCDSPRPYSRVNIVQGTRGIFRGYPEAKVYIEGRSPEHQWEPADAYIEQYNHPLWKHIKEVLAAAEKKSGGGHGGADFIEIYRLIEALRHGKPLDFDVYDAASWSVVSALSEESVANRSKAVDFPDFTKGKWRTMAPVQILGV